MGAFKDRIAAELLAAAERGERAQQPTPKAHEAKRIARRIHKLRPDATTEIADHDGTPCYQPGVAIERTNLIVSFAETTNVGNNRSSSV